MIRSPFTLITAGLLMLFLIYSMCGRKSVEDSGILEELTAKGLQPEVISSEMFLKGIAPPDFLQLAGAEYKPSYNEDPGISPQCWIETSYGTQNACKYCHTDYLASVKHGNAYPIAEDQILYSFPSENLNKILWRNIIYPHEMIERLLAEGISLPEADDYEYVRTDNWTPAWLRARGNGNSSWMNTADDESSFALFPALNPNHLFPFTADDPTGGNMHGYVDREGFVKNEKDEYTGWRAINFFPYAIFTPLTGSVSGIYIRLPEKFMTKKGSFSADIYKENLDLLERNIKNQATGRRNYVGDASREKIKKGFYPVGTEFAHPLHYVDLKADGETGFGLDGLLANEIKDYEFPGTRSKRVKEIRYMYKWKDVYLADISIPEDEEDGEDFEHIIGREGQGWADNDAGWILSAFIEDRYGNLRPQTTEELAQCIGCHGKVGNTVDAVWSFQRKLPGSQGWGEMDYGQYHADSPDKTRLNDFVHENSGMGELGYFYYTVVGADLYGVMPGEIRAELTNYTIQQDLFNTLNLNYNFQEIFDDEVLKFTDRKKRKQIMEERQKIMRHYSEAKEYLYFDEETNNYLIKGSIFYPTWETMLNNIRMYRMIVLDQSYNLGKDVFGTEKDNLPFTFRSDGTVLDEYGNAIQVGEIISSRPFGEDGVGITPTGLVKVNEFGEPVDDLGVAIDIENESHRAAGHISSGGTFDMYYNPILSGKTVRK
jgi:hypothetical protein